MKYFLLGNVIMSSIMCFNYYYLNLLTSVNLYATH